MFKRKVHTKLDSANQSTILKVLAEDIGAIPAYDHSTPSEPKSERPKTPKTPKPQVNPVKMKAENAAKGALHKVKEKLSSVRLPTGKVSLPLPTLTDGSRFSRVMGSFMQTCGVSPINIITLETDGMNGGGITFYNKESALNDKEMNETTCIHTSDILSTMAPRLNNGDYLVFNQPVDFVGIETGEIRDFFYRFNASGARLVFRGGLNLQSVGHHNVFHTLVEQVLREASSQVLASKIHVDGFAPVNVGAPVLMYGPMKDKAIITF